MLYIQNSKIEVDEKAWCGPQGELLALIQPTVADPISIRKDLQGMWRYLPFLPLKREENIVSMGEGMTPLISLQHAGKKLYAKLEFLFPSGSFKDRGASFLMSKLKELGIDEIVEDSSGNAGSAMAAYAAIAGIKCHIVVPNNCDEAKIRQMQQYGAQIIQVAGNRQMASDKARELAARFYHAGHAINPWFFMGTMTFAFEIWEQNAIPEEIIFPTGNGTLILGAYLGFKLLKEKGLISELPRLSVAQSDACAPLFYRFKKMEFPGSTQGLAKGILVENPVRAEEILEAVRLSNGHIYTCTEKEILDAGLSLAQKGLYVEYSSAVAYAVLHQSKTEHILIPLTGSGLKNNPL